MMAIVEKKSHVADSHSELEELEMELIPPKNRSAYSALPESNLTDAENEERHLHSSATAPPSLGSRKRSLQKRQTLRMEEGQ